MLSSLNNNATSSSQKSISRVAQRHTLLHSKSTSRENLKKMQHDVLLAGAADGAAGSQQSSHSQSFKAVELKEEDFATLPSSYQDNSVKSSLSIASQMDKQKNLLALQWQRASSPHTINAKLLEHTEAVMY